MDSDVEPPTKEKLMWNMIDNNFALKVLQFTELKPRIKDIFEEYIWKEHYNFFKLLVVDSLFHLIVTEAEKICRAVLRKFQKFRTKSWTNTIDDEIDFLLDSYCGSVCYD